MLNTKQNNNVLNPFLKAFFGKVYNVAHVNNNPESFNGIVFYNATKADKKRHNYFIKLNNSTMLSDDQISRIVDIINESHDENNKFTVTRPNNDEQQPPDQEPKQQPTDEQK